MKKYIVWVGGVEVNDYLLTKKEAETLADEYQDYDDVIIEEATPQEALKKDYQFKKRKIKTMKGTK